MALYISPPPQLNIHNPFQAPHNLIANDFISAPHMHFPKEGLEMLYAAENRHFWHIARCEFIYNEVLRAFRRFYKLSPHTQNIKSANTESTYFQEDYKNAKILDVGAGTGSVTRYFLRNGFKHIALGEIYPQGLEYAKSYGISQLFCMDLLDVPFRDEFDCIFAFDVIEHIENDTLVLQNMRKMLKKHERSFIAISVPAHKWLWNAHDELLYHKRRYTKKHLVSLLQKCGFKIESARYFFTAITPLLYLRALLNPAHKAHKQAHTPLRDVPPPFLFNKLLLHLCRFENTLQNLASSFSAPFGGSLFVIARVAK
ncbi:class I SAM-dependent methyltransferase [Helicobacter jaachi]|uniref:Class I SAM-dependent methyltransferase n=2 Tax=Helicobacter jaachi TaxID=1677920 RepID=A0A4V6I2D4_9HELI|nr:class I SAM-dependent methyltransferase [Helicobacter jaachi]